MAAKTLRIEGGTDCTQEEQIAVGRAAKRLALVKLRALMTSGRRICKKPKDDSYFNKIMKQISKRRACEKAFVDALQKEGDADEEHYGRLPDPVVHTPFEERQYGHVTSRECATRDFPCSVVSIALFDGATMLFACSGIPLPGGRSKLEITRYVTSARLAREYKCKSYRDDKLRIEVHLPNDEKTAGFLELYNKHIAIVTLLDDQYGNRRLDVELQAELPSDGDHMLAVGRAFNSGSFMTAKVNVVPCGRFDPHKLQLDPPNSEGRLCFWKPLSSYEGGPVAVLGGPVIGTDNRITGMNVDVDLDGACVSFLPLGLLYRYLKHFRILDPKELHFRRYSLPDHADTIAPSGFMRDIYRLKHLGYSMPSPLVFELNGTLLNQFEDSFGDIRAWKGYPYGSDFHCDEPVWRHLRKNVVKDISRRVVSVTSFHGYERYFVCKGLLIKWHQGTVVLTSASLVRRCNDEDIYEDKIDDDLTIEVFLPPKQRVSGKLELHSLKYNIAIVSFKKKFISICPEDISSKYYLTPKLSGKVVAVGREPLDGLLMASIGKVKRRDKGCKLDCKDLKLSTCEMKKAGIGGPLINLDGSFVGMNFFDGRMLTPFLPRSKILQVLRSKINLPLPSESKGYYVPMHLEDAGGEPLENRWPVPEPYWYHGILDVDWRFHEHVGRVLE